MNNNNDNQIVVYLLERWRQQFSCSRRKESVHRIRHCTDCLCKGTFLTFFFSDNFFCEAHAYGFVIIFQQMIQQLISRLASIT